MIRAEFKRPSRATNGKFIGWAEIGGAIIGRGCHDLPRCRLDDAQGRDDAASDQRAREGWAHPDRRRPIAAR